MRRDLRVHYARQSGPKSRPQNENYPLAGDFWKVSGGPSLAGLRAIFTRFRALFPLPRYPDWPILEIFGKFLETFRRSRF